MINHCFYQICLTALQENSLNAKPVCPQELSRCSWVQISCLRFAISVGQQPMSLSQNKNRRCSWRNRKPQILLIRTITRGRSIVGLELRLCLSHHQTLEVGLAQAKEIYKMLVLEWYFLDPRKRGHIKNHRGPVWWNKIHQINKTRITIRRSITLRLIQETDP